MKRTIIYCSMTILLLGGMLGCAGTEVKRASGPPPVSLDKWLGDIAFPKIQEALKNNSFMKGVPFIIVTTRGEIVSNRIDGLTEDVRERLVSVLLEQPEISLVRRHPAKIIDRPYKLQDIPCGRYVEHRMLLTIDIKALGAAEDNLARVNIRAIDRKKDTWIRGFSIHENVALSSEQGRELQAPPAPDQYLRGLKYAPFAESERDELAAYLARSLSCIFREGAGKGGLKVFIDSSKVGRRAKDIAWFMKRQLRFCNEITVVDERKKADWVLKAEAKETGGPAGLAQFWVTSPNKRGLATYAYFKAGDPGDQSLVGRWKVIDLPSRRSAGFFQISSRGSGEYVADILGPDGISLVKSGVIINLKNRRISWTYFDEDANRTYSAEGVILEGGERMTVTVTPFPASGGRIRQELIPVE